MSVNLRGSTRAPKDTGRQLCVQPEFCENLASQHVLGYSSERAMEFKFCENLTYIRPQVIFRYLRERAMECKLCANLTCIRSHHSCLHSFSLQCRHYLLFFLRILLFFHCLFQNPLFKPLYLYLSVFVERATCAKKTLHTSGHSTLLDA